MSIAKLSRRKGKARDEHDRKQLRHQPPRRPPNRRQLSLAEPIFISAGRNLFPPFVLTVIILPNSSHFRLHLAWKITRWLA
jgi:hypothetical protein